MKVIVLCALAFVAVVYADDQYTTKYDNIDLDEILKNDRLLNNYVNCVLEKGNCTPDGAELKKRLPEALENDCLKCSEKQRVGSRKIVRYLIENKPEVWKLLEAKYDVDGKYKKKYESEAQKAGIKV